MSAVPTMPLDESHEWLETNGLGSFAMGTATGTATRRYHAILCAATRPPGARMVMANALEETVSLPDGRRFSLDAHHYPGNVTHPDGPHWLVEFTTTPWPTWRYQIGGITVERELWMPHGQQATIVRWRATGKVELEVRPLLAGRDYHALHHANAAVQQKCEHLGVATIGVTLYPGVPSLYFHHDGAFADDWRWYYRVQYPVEAERGLDHEEDLVSPGVFTFALGAAPASLVVSLAAEPLYVSNVESGERARRQLSTSDRAASQFVVNRDQGKAVVAGYPWFTDWGRDTLISLPGLALPLDEEGALLQTIARHMKNGLIPNRFSDDGTGAEYNAADASLWFVLATTQHATRRGSMPAELAGAARDVVEAYLGGSDFGIHIDDDGFVHAGAPGFALTWMDARVDGVPVTPRGGCPVELQALWVAALESLAPHFESTDGGFWGELIERAAWTRSSFGARFWNEDGGYLYDVLDGPRKDATLRPNQLYALGLCTPLIDLERAKRALSTVEATLLTPMGLRSRAPGGGYIARYEGGPAERDRAYHQGTVWPHLIGIFADACRRVRGSFDVKILDHLVQHLDHYGSVPEICDGDAPHAARGCPAQAWAVCELRRALR